SDTSSTHNTFYSPSIFLHCSFTFLLLPRQPPRSTPFPYTTLFRSPKITDGNRATYWSTEQYRDFQKSKPGVGVVLDAQGAVQLRSEEHTSELQSRGHLVCRLLLEKKKNVLPPVRFNLNSRNLVSPHPKQP